ncbi:hypothetical protein [Candidatus Solirubrobacter pratensis]|uniref:hypothetical protein n=1 Tax=Candidatus Solirubrobacter pratensis TaxID=1298857 RepID=UPI00040B07B4|nr:hypothetical protein [Candidatus Solirubrobacter pratensis]
MADPTAITAVVGIVVSGVVGPSVGGWIASRRAAREHEYSRVLVDRKEAREVLDDATQHLGRAGRLRGALDSLFMTHAASIRANQPSHIEAFHEASRVVDLDHARLALRFGSEHPVVVAHADAWRALVFSSDAVNIAADLGQHADVAKSWEKLKQSGADFDAAYERFSAAAHELAAVQLQPRSSRR